MRPVFAVLLCAIASFAQSTQSIPFRATLSPLNEIPIIEGSNARGFATVWIHAVRDAQGNLTRAAVDFNVRYSFGGPITVTGLHIHRGTAAVNGPVVIDSGIRGAAATEDAAGNAGAVRQAVVTSTEGLATVAAILDNPDNFYVNLHTTVNPGGAIRGQMARAASATLMGQMSPAKEIPAISGLAASGVATIVALAARNPQGTLVSGEVTFDVQYTGFPAETTFTGLHIHAGARDVNGPVVINTGLSANSPNAAAGAGGAGGYRFTVDVDTSNAAAAAALAGLLTNPAGYYVNIHTRVNPGGAIRTQLQNADTVSFNLNPSAANEVPPIAGLTATSPSVFSLNSIRDGNGAIVATTAIFNTSHSFGANTSFTGMHIHEGVAGQNGPVHIDSGLRGARASESGVGNIYLINAITTAAGLAAASGLLQNPANYYFNLHTSANPGGAVRAQLGTLVTDAPEITDVFGQLSGADVRIANVGGLFRIAGNRLAGGPGTASQDTTPTSLNGTSVEIGGVAAQLVSVSANSLVARIPSSLLLGVLPVRSFTVFVTTPNGRSNVANLQVTSVQTPN